MDRRRELKLQYKQNPLPPKGVYQIKNEKNGKIFVGSSLNLQATSNSYLSKLNFQKHYNHDLQEDLKSYGDDVFSFEVLGTIDTEKMPKGDWQKAVWALEDQWLDQLQPYGAKGYNNKKTK